MAVCVTATGGLTGNCGVNDAGFLLGITFGKVLLAKGLLRGDVSFSESAADLLPTPSFAGGLRLATCGLVCVNGSGDTSRLSLFNYNIIIFN